MYEDFINKKGFLFEFEELFTPKQSIRILNPQKIQGFLGFFRIYFRIFLGVRGFDE